MDEPKSGLSLTDIEKRFRTACISGNLEEVKSIVEKEGFNNIAFVTSIFLEIANENKFEMIFYLINTFLIEVGKIEDKDGNKLLHIVAIKGDVISLAKLVDGGIFAFNATNRLEQQALHLAILHCHFELTEYLVSKYKDHVLTARAECVISKGKFCFTPLQLAIALGNDRITSFLLECLHNQDVSTITHSVGNSYLHGNILHIAVFCLQNEMLKKLLIDHRVVGKHLWHQENEYGLTPLSLAAYLGNLEAVSILYEQDNAVLSGPSRKNSPLHWAIEGMQVEVVKKIISLVRDPYIIDRLLHHVNQKNKKPIDLAKKLKRHAKYQTKESQSIIKLHLIVNFLKNTEANTHQIDFLAFPPENLVFAAASHNNLFSYVGALQRLEEQYKNANQIWGGVRRVAGTSLSTIIAILLAFDYRVNEMPAIISEFQSILAGIFRESSFLSNTLQLNDINESLKGWNFKAFKTVVGLFHWYSKMMTNNFFEFVTGKALRDWIDKIIEKKLSENCEDNSENHKNFTFGQLNALVRKKNGYKHLYITATQIVPEFKMVIFNSEDDNMEDVIIADAARASMAIPFLFQPYCKWVKYSDRSIEISNEVYLAGQIIKDYPLDIFDKAKYQALLLRSNDQQTEVFNQKTLGFTMEHELPSVNLNNLVGTSTLGIVNYISFIISCQSYSTHLSAFESKKHLRTITIPRSTDEKFINFNLDNETMLMVKANGENAVDGFFRKFSSNKMPNIRTLVDSMTQSVLRPHGLTTINQECLLESSKILISDEYKEIMEEDTCVVLTSPVNNINESTSALPSSSNAW